MTVSAAPVVELAAPFAPTVKQLEMARACLDRDARVIVLDGAIRSGKTQCAGRLLVETAIERPAVYLVGRSDNAPRVSTSAHPRPAVAYAS